MSDGIKMSANRHTSLTAAFKDPQVISGLQTQADTHKPN